MSWILSGLRSPGWGGLQEKKSGEYAVNAPEKSLSLVAESLVSLDFSKLQSNERLPTQTAKSLFEHPLVLLELVMVDITLEVLELLTAVVQDE